MSILEQPLVSVLTPVYNGGDFLAECIESVLGQTYKNFEYIIVNNCSTDRSLEMAQAYAKKDSRVRVHNNEKFVGVIENHNTAFRLISPQAGYCKVVSADDFIFADCLKQMVAVGKSNPSAGIIGAYQISGKRVLWQGFRYPRSLLPGRDICRQIFLEGDPSFGFGTPTSLLYRADLIRNSPEFYPNPSPHADTSACFKHLKDTDFGFVYQTLCYERTHDETQSSKSAEMNRYSSAYLDDLMRYGPHYLSQEECAQKVKEQLNRYFEFLAVNVFRSRGGDFWSYHRGRLKELGYPIRTPKLLRAGLGKIIREMLNPGQALGKLRSRLFPRQAAQSIPGGSRR